MGNLRPFEIGLIAFFAVAAIAGLILISVIDPGDPENAKKYGERVLIWGTFDKEKMDQFLAELKDSDDALNVVSYRQIDEDDFEDVIVDAIAEGRAPDMVILPHDQLVTTRTKLRAIPYETFPERTYTDTYIDGASIFMMSDGIYGIPIAVDPLVMYWNKNLFSTAGFARQPTTWEQIKDETVKSLRNVNNRREVIQAALAFGEYRNVAHAKEILAMLMLQSGTSLVEEWLNGGNNAYKVTIDQSEDISLSPALASLTLYTQFALPLGSLYTWNRSMNIDRDEFLAGDLALYFGPGSDWYELEKDNPNLFFDAAMVPQGAGSTATRTYGDFYAFAFLKSSPNVNGAYAVANLIASDTYAQKITDKFNLAPVRRSLHVPQTDPMKSVLYSSALIARGWLDPEPLETDVIFRDMVEAVTSGDTRKNQIISDAKQKLESSF